LVIDNKLDDYIYKGTTTLFGAYFFIRGISEYVGDPPNYPYFFDSIERKMMWRYIGLQDVGFYIY
jgi:hypothetical protein